MADSGSDTAPPLNLVFTANEFKSQHVVIPSTPSATEEKAGVEAESSSTTNLMSAYLNLPHHLKSCVDYSYFLLTNSSGCRKERLACLLLAEGLIKQDNSSTLDEDAASTVIDELIGLGMLQKYNLFFRKEWVSIPFTHRKLCIGKVEGKDLFAKAPDLAIRLYILDDETNYLYPNLGSLKITSLFDVRGKIYDKCISRADMETICKLKSLVVLDLDGSIECLPDEIGDLVHLKYLRLNYSNYTKPPFVSFEMMFCHVNELPAEVLDIQRLWHLMINRNTFNSIVGVPRKIGLRLNLVTLTRIDARGGIRSELSKFTQLRRLEIYCVSEEHATELCAAIMKMTYLLSLSMEAEKTTFVTGNKEEVVAPFPEFEAFSPPSRLQIVNLTGQLVDIPGWLLSLENLSTLSLTDSYLHDDSIFQLQFLPNLKYLDLYNAIRLKQIGEEFCQAGGFPKLERLRISSTFLVEWSEIANGAFPNLRSLTFEFCRNLMFLPNGLQNITTLDELFVDPIHGDLERRLQGIENYKINNIPKVRLFSR